MRKKYLFYLLLGLTIFAQSCAPTFITAPVTRPSEYNFKEYNIICAAPCIGPFGHNAMGKRIDSVLYGYLADSCNIRLISTLQFEDSLSKIGLTLSGVLKPENKNKLAKFGKIALISSKIMANEYDFHDCFFDGNDLQFDVGVANVNIFFKIIDLTSEQILLSKNFETISISKDKIFSIEEDRRTLFQNAYYEIVKDFSKFIHPFTETLKIDFLIDSDIPVLQEGVDLISKGAWNEGIMKFESAVPLAKDKDLQALIYYDLALAYQYTFSFDKAREAFTRACALSDEEKYFEAAELCSEMENDFLETRKPLSEDDK